MKIKALSEEISEGALFLKVKQCCIGDFEKVGFFSKKIGNEVQKKAIYNRKEER